MSDNGEKVDIVVGAKVDGEWPVTIDGEVIEGTVIEKCNAIGKAVTEADGKEFVAEHMSWYHEDEDKWCETCADVQLAQQYMLQDYERFGTDGPDMLIKLGYTANLATKIALNLLFSF